MIVTSFPLPHECSAGGWASFSLNRTYRWGLGRQWDDRKMQMTFVMLNPSSAGCLNDDPTIRKCIGFANRHGCGGIEVVNLFGLVSTDPKGLLKVEDPVGPCNDTALRWAMARPLVVAAWGRFPKKLRKAIQPISSIPAGGLRCFGVTKDGQPRHPLMLAYSTRLQDLDPVAFRDLS